MPAEVEDVSTGRAALARLAARGYGAVLYRMDAPGIHVLTFVREAVRLRPGLPIFLVADDVDPRDADRAGRLGAVFLSGRRGLRGLLEHVRQALSGIDRLVRGSRAASALLRTLSRELKASMGALEAGECLSGRLESLADPVARSGVSRPRRS